MSVIDSGGNSPYDEAELSDVETHLLTRIEQLEDVVEDQQETIDQLRDAVEDDADDDQEDAVDDEQMATVQWDGDDHEDLKVVSSDGTTFPLGLSISSKVSQTDLQDELDDVEDRLSDRETHSSDGEDTHADGCVTPETPLEQTVGLPDEMVSNESANVQRAIFVARDVDDYTASVPAGRAITSGELRRVLKAGTDCNGHSQTVDRVIEILDDMGQDAVKVVKRRGERRIVFDEQLCHRLRELSQDERDANHTVVSQGGT